MAISVLALPNVDMVLRDGWTINAGLYGSLVSGAVAADTELGFILTVLRDMHLQ